MGAKMQRFELRMDREEIAQVDDWRRHQADLPSRAEAIRRLIQFGLKASPSRRLEPGLKAKAKKR
jgi:hypothetical protein